MIFVTVGTHEQQFNRLIKCIDELKAQNILCEDIFMQIGYCTYVPQYCHYEKILSYEQMLKNIKNAHIVVTHGGPSSFILPLQMGKIPIVVPRNKEYGEHVNSHQVDFLKQVSTINKNIIPVYNIDELKNCLVDYDSLINNMPKELLSNNKNFNNKLLEIVDELVRHN